MTVYAPQIVKLMIQSSFLPQTSAYEFIYWLQGFFENANPSALNEEQTAAIKTKLDSCFMKVTHNPNFDYKHTNYGDFAQPVAPDFTVKLDESNFPIISQSC
ncbi:MAG: hypothetical protein V4736_10230 [Bdellovibrionota bacterium]